MKNIQSVSKGEIFEITSIIPESVHHSARMNRPAWRPAAVYWHVHTDKTLRTL